MKKTFKKFLATLGLIGLGVGAFSVGIAVPKITFDAIESINESVGTNLPLMHAGVYLKSGTHKVIFTEQFYNELTKDTTKEEQYIAVNSIKKAFENLSELNTKINFKLYTINDGLTEYGIDKTDDFSTRNDIPLYISINTLENNKNVLAKTDWNYSMFTYELKDEKITYKKDALFVTWTDTDKDMTEGEFDYLDCCAYTITAHEAMHVMGFSHIDDKDSLMYPYLSVLYSNHDFSEKDKKRIDLYNVEFYKATPRYADYSDIVKTEQTTSKTNKHEFDEEDNLAF